MRSQSFREAPPYIEEGAVSSTDHYACYPGSDPAWLANISCDSQGRIITVVVTVVVRPRPHDMARPRSRAGSVRRLPGLGEQALRAPTRTRTMLRRFHDSRKGQRRTAPGVEPRERRSVRPWGQSSRFRGGLAAAQGGVRRSAQGLQFSQQCSRVAARSEEAASEESVGELPPPDLVSPARPTWRSDGIHRVPLFTVAGAAAQRLARRTSDLCDPRPTPAPRLTTQPVLGLPPPYVFTNRYGPAWRAGGPAGRRQSGH
ncbi:unnamed protein product [Lampetra fluviatilis]